MGKLIPPKEYVKQRFPNATYVYKDVWDKKLRRFSRIYSIYQDESDAFNSLKLKIGEAGTLEEAWENAQFNIQIH